MYGSAYATTAYGGTNTDAAASPTMSKTLTIAGANFLPQYVTNSARITEHIQNQTNVLTFQLTVKSGQSMPVEGSEIVFKDGSRFLFGGFLTRIDPTEYGEGEFFVYDVEASDYGWIFNNKVAAKAYTDSTLKTVVENLMSLYVDSGYGFTTTNVDTGPTINSITFDHISLRNCFEKISKLTGYVWWVDYEKNLYFQAPTATAAPEEITDTSDNFSDITISYDTTQVRNHVTVIGSDNGEQAITTRTETFTADGETRSWRLSEKPSEVTEITVDGVSQQFSLDLNERDTDTFVYSFNDARFRQTDGETTLTNESIEITYYPRVPIIAFDKDEDSIAFFAAKDGGDGEYRYTIKETSISTKAEAKERVNEELDEFADPLAKGIFHTRTGLLSGGSIFGPGQLLTVNLPSWGISTDTAFLIQQVTIDMVEDEDNSTTEYHYTVRFGGKIVDVETFLATLAQTGEEVTDTEEIKTIFGETDSFPVVDNAPTHTLFTPPFEYGPSGSPQGKWNLSEWA